MSTASASRAADLIATVRRDASDGALRLAYHAALPVVIDSGLLNLLRVNFFLDPPDALPYEAEADLLLSPLFREIGSDLYEIEPGTRNTLLVGLHSRYGPARVRQVALLLEQYTDSTLAWTGQPELEQAQRLTALSFVDPDRAQAWLDTAHADGKAAALSREWYVAMRLRLAAQPVDADLTQQIGVAAGQLQDAALEVRLAGIRSLRALAQLPDGDADAIADALAVLIRRTALTVSPDDEIPADIQAALSFLGRMRRGRAVDLSDAILRRADLRHLAFAGDIMRRVALSNCDATRVNLAGADLEGAAFWQVTADGASLVGARLRSASLSHVELRGADLSEADLTDAELLAVDFTGANLQSALLPSFDHMTRTDFSDGALSGAVIALGSDGPAEPYEQAGPDGDESAFSLSPHGSMSAATSAPEATAPGSGGLTAEQLREGQVLTGTVTEIVANGAVIDLGGVLGFAATQELAWRLIDDPHDAVQLGQGVIVEVTGVFLGDDFDVDSDQERVSLSVRATEPDPWPEFAREHPVGVILPGRVARLVPYGAFVRINDFVEGLLHLSEIEDRPIQIPEQAVQPGEEVWVKVIDWDVDRHRLSLSMKQATVPDNEDDFDPTLYGMPAEYDEQGNYIYPDGFDPETGEWRPGSDAEREEWVRHYSAARERWLEHRAAVAAKQATPAEGGDAAAESTPESAQEALDRYQRSRSEADLDGAVKRIRQELGHPSIKPAARAPLLAVLGELLRQRFERRGVLQDLDGAVQAGDEALQLTSHREVERPRYLTSLSSTLITRFRYRGDAADLERAVELAEEAAVTAPTADVLFSALSNLCAGLKLRSELTGALADLDRAIQAGDRALAGAPDEHPGLSLLQTNVAIALRARFERTGQLADLDRAISLGEIATHTAGPGDPARPLLFNNLGLAYRQRFRRLDEAADIDRAVYSATASVHESTADDPARPLYLANLSAALLSKAALTGAPADLDEAIFRAREAVETSPSGNPERARAFVALSNALRLRFGQLEDPQDIADAIAVLRQAVAVLPSGDVNEGAIHAGLAQALLARHEHADRIGDTPAAPGDLDEAISHFDSALADTRGPTSRRTGYLTSLGEALQARYRQSGDKKDMARSLAVQQEVSELTDRLQREAGSSDAPPSEAPASEQERGLEA